MTLTYYSDHAIKAVRIERCKAHIEADRLRSGSYGHMQGKKFVACAIGCQIYDIANESGVDWREILGNKHALVASDYGWPLWLCRLEDGIFEGLPKADQAAWPLRLVTAVPVGRDISTVRHGLLAFILREVVTFDRAKEAAISKIVDQIADMHERAARGEAIESAVESAVWSAAESAVWSAAESAAESAVWSAVRSAVWSAVRSAAESAAESAEWSAVRSAAESAAYKKIADKLISLLEAA